MKKKIFLSMTIVLGVFVLAGCSLFGGDKKEGTDNKNGSNVTKTKEDAGSGTGESLFGFLTASKGVKCEVEDETGKSTIISDGNRKAKVEGFDFATPQGGEKKGKGTMVNDGEWIYIWGEGQKEGLKFNAKEAEATAKKNGDVDQEGGMDWKAWAKSLEASGAKYKCSPTVVTDNDFVAPKDVVFRDLAEMFKQFENLGNQGQNISIPSQK